jgi:hypothetical protein
MSDPLARRHFGEGSDASGNDAESSRNTTAPRWEWRVFGEKLQLPDSHRLEMHDTEPETEEVYLLSRRSIQNVKLRRDAVDIKWLDAVDTGGLERWRPAGHFVFPLGPTQIARIQDALGVVIRERLGYPLDRARFLRCITRLEPEVVAVPVLKRRTRFTLAGCEGERVELVIDGRRLQSLALEDVNPAFLTTAVRMTGITDPVNLSYPRLLKAIRGIGDAHDGLSETEALVPARTHGA